MNRRHFLKSLGFGAVGIALAASPLAKMLSGGGNVTQDDVEKVVNDSLEKDVDLSEELEETPWYKVYEKANLTSAVAIVGLFGATTAAILAGKKEGFDQDTMVMFNAAERTRIAVLKWINRKYKIDEKIEVMIKDIDASDIIEDKSKKKEQLEKSKLSHHIGEEIHGMIESYIVSTLAVAIVDYGEKIEVDTRDLLGIEEKPEDDKSVDELGTDSRSAVVNMFTGTFWLSSMYTNFVGSSVSQKAKPALSYTYEAYLRKKYQAENPESTTEEIQNTVKKQYNDFSSYLTNMCYHLPSNTQGMFSPLLIPSGGIPNIFYFIQEQLKNPHALYIDYINSGFQSLIQTYIGINKTLKMMGLTTIQKDEFLSNIKKQMKVLVGEKFVDIAKTITSNQDHNITNLKRLFEERGDNFATTKLQEIIDARPAVTLNIDDRFLHVIELFKKSPIEVEGGEEIHSEMGDNLYTTYQGVFDSIEEIIGKGSNGGAEEYVENIDIEKQSSKIADALKPFITQLESTQDAGLASFFIDHINKLKIETKSGTLLDAEKVYDKPLFPGFDGDTEIESIKTFGDIFRRIKDSETQASVANTAHFTNIIPGHEHFGHVPRDALYALGSQMPVVPSLNVTANTMITHVLEKLDIKEPHIALLTACLIAMCIINAMMITPHADNVAAMINNNAIIKEQVKKIFGEKGLDNDFAMAILTSCAKQISITFGSSFKAGCPSNFPQTKHEFEYNTEGTPQIREIPLTMGETWFPKTVLGMNMRSLFMNILLTTAACTMFTKTEKN